MTPSHDPSVSPPRALNVMDFQHRRRRGSLQFLSSISPDAPIPGPAPGEDFRIIIALAPVDGLPQPPRGTAVCAPAAPLGVGTIREGAPAYATKGRRSALALSPADIDPLARGRLFSALELEQQPTKSSSSVRRGWTSWPGTCSPARPSPITWSP